MAFTSWIQVLERPVLPRDADLAILDRDGRPLCMPCVVASRLPQRLRGLVGRDSLEVGEGLLLTGTWSVHTALMRFPIDVVFLGRLFDVRAVVESLAPWRVAYRRGAWAVLELAAGECRAHDIRVGDRLGWAAQPVRPSERSGTTRRRTAPGGHGARTI